MKIAILCASTNSHYYSLAHNYDLKIYNRLDDCRNFDFSCPVIAHPPCPQWSRLHHFATYNQEEKMLAWFCLLSVIKCGGIFEHPSGSHFFKTAGIKPTLSIDQHWWGYPVRKRTYLYFNRCSPGQHPLNFNAMFQRKFDNLSPNQRSATPIGFNEFLINSILNSHSSQIVKSNP